MTLAVPAAAVLDGFHLRAVPTDAWQIRPEERRHVRQAATGRRREVLLASAAGQPLRRTLRSFALAWTHIGALRPDVEELLATPGQHTLVLWREEFVAYRGDGITTELALPNGWLLAVDQVDPLPAELTAASLAPQVKLGRACDVLAYSLQPLATFEAGDPPAGEVWFCAGEPRLKLGDVPDDGTTVYVRLVPVYRVYEDPSPIEVRLEGPIREPRDVSLLEVG